MSFTCDQQQLKDLACGSCCPASSMKADPQHLLSRFFNIVAWLVGPRSTSVVNSGRASRIRSHAQLLP